MKRKKGLIWGLVYGTALTAFTGYVMLDTFKLPSVQQEQASQMNMALFENEETKTLTGGSSQQENSSDSSETDSPASDSSEQESVQDSSSESGRHGKKRPSGDGSGMGMGRHKSDTDTETDTDTDSDSSAQSADSSSSFRTETATAASSGSSYSDENISITMKEYYENDTKIYVADVQLSSAQYLKTALANDSFGKNVTQTTSEMAEAKNAILAVNGDFYGAKESGYVIRNGILYRDYGNEDTDVLCIYADGSFEITNSGEKTAQQLIDDGVWQAFSFGPALLEDGSVQVSEGEEVGKAMASNPRTAIGIVDDLHYLFVVSDGRSDESKGLSLVQLAEFMESLGAKTAYNLDGGGSSTMYYDGAVVNNPTTSGRNSKERSVSDIVYIGY